jgi:mono/diheme cytochrome c family protein
MVGPTSRKHLTQQVGEGRRSAGGQGTPSELFMRRIKSDLLGSLLGLVSLAVAGGSPGSAQPRDDAGARAAFLEAFKVFMHPRCVNCHPSGDAPLRGDDSRPHTFFRLRRGADGQGVFAVKCSNCHQAQNQPGLHMPPGAPYPLKNGAEDQAHRGEPGWHLPPAATPMVFEKRTPGQLCRQLLDQRQNGGLTPEQLVLHVSHDPLVLWGWNPGEGRSAPPLSHVEFVQKVREWVDKGCACPK